MSARPLSPRQAETLRAVLTGKTIKEIASDMGVVPNTAKQHVEVILNKTGRRSRSEIVQRHVQELRAALVELRVFLALAAERDVLNAEEVAPLLECADDALAGKRAVQS